MAALTRSTLYALLEADARLDGWEIYAEPPEQLAGAAVVVAPRSPYQAWGSFSEIETHVVLHVLVPRAHGPAMDRIDTGLAALRTILYEIEGVGIGAVTSVGVLDDVGASKYIVASVDVDLT